MPWLEDLKFPRGYQMGTHNKLFSIKIEKVRVLTKYLDTIFKTIIGYQSTSVIVYEAFHSEQLNATLTTLVEKLFTTFFLYIALVFFSWQ